MMAELHNPPNTITVEVPQDILFCNILPRVPAKSLLRFRAVSKQWQSLLTTPLFEKMHLHHVTNDDHQNHQKLLVLSTKTPFVFRTIDCEAPEEGLTASRPLPFEAEDMRVLTSRNGLVCVGINYDMIYSEHSALILWNPVTGDYKRLSKSYCHDRTISYLKAFGLYYTSCEDEYKLLCIDLDFHAYVYSLKTDAWRKIDSSEELMSTSPYGYWSAGTQVNEKLYFLCESYNRSEPCWVIMFDTMTEKLTMLATPIPIRGHRMTTCLSHQGCLHLYVVDMDMEKYSVKLWRLDSATDWKKLVTYRMPKTESWTQPLHVMRDGNWLTHYSCRNLVCKIDLATDTKNILCSLTKNMNIPTAGKYIETLVSANRYL